ncbi:MAG: HDOD domain-containing protein [Methyloversatilis sp.]|jgi:signal transduction histidine kinase|nr:HDOD domain-containing protein [Methyloversatilis sp.]
MTAPVARAIDCAMLSGLPSLPLLADVALGLRALPAGVPSINALLRHDPVWVLRLLRASELIAAPAGDGSAGQRIDAVIDACGNALIQVALLDARTRVQRSGVDLAGHRAFWAHSMLTAEIARELAVVGGRCDPEESFIAGLLLDVALPLLAAAPGGSERHAQRPAEHELAALETACGGEHHGEIAAALLSADWASGLADALRFSHADGALFVDAPELLRLARAAEELAGGGAADTAQQRALAQRLTGLTADALDAALQVAHSRALERCRQVELDAADTLLVAGACYRPSFDVTDAQPDDSAALTGFARAGLFGQVYARADEATLWTLLKLSSALLLDLPAPQILRAGQGGSAFMPIAAQDEQAPRIDFAQTGLEGVWRQLSSGAAWLCSDAREAVTLPVGLQRLLRVSSGQTGLIQPLCSEAGVEALALYHFPASFAPPLMRRSDELRALAEGAGRALRLQQQRLRELGELRQGMVEQYAVHARQLRADLHTPLGLMRHQIKSMRLKMGADSMVDSELTVFGDQIDRVDTVLRQFEGRPPDVSAEAQRIDLNQLMEQTVAEIEERVLRTRSISTELHLDAALPPLHLPLGTLRELMHALLAISAEQVGTSGRIAVSTAEGLNLNGSLFAEVRVRDFGRGMDAARVAALFAPDGSGGTRATPAHALALARSLGGSLSCKSAVGQGTVYQLLLPRTTRRPTLAAAVPL